MIVGFVVSAVARIIATRSLLALSLNGFAVALRHAGSPCHPVERFLEMSESRSGLAT
jgi:hypothetical protein